MMLGCPGGLLQSLCGEANKILLASALSSMHAMCPNRISRRAWIITVSFSCFVCLRTSSRQTKWYHLMPSNIRRHHWSSALILCTLVLETSQHSDTYRKIGRITWLSTIQHDLRCHNLTLPEAVDNRHGLESPSMEVAVDVRHYAILELHASDDEEEVL